MGMLRLCAISFILLALAACRAGPPAQLAGLWSTGPASCSAGIGLEFNEKSVDAVYAADRQILFLNPRYEMRGGGDEFRVRIRYDVTKAHKTLVGVLDLQRQRDGSLRPIAHRIHDTLTGATRLRVGEDPLALALMVRPCAPNAWNGDLRGRTSR